MPYISADQTKSIKKQLKKEFPDFKFSVRNRNRSAVFITILSGPVDLLKDTERHQEQVNQFYIEENYTGEKEKILSRINEIANKGNGISSTDCDYGTIPKFYVNIRIGDYDRPYKVIN